MQAVERGLRRGRAADALRHILRAAAALTLAASVAACGGMKAGRSAGDGVAGAPKPQAPAIAPGRYGDVRPVATGQPARIALLAPVGPDRTRLNNVGRSIANGAQLALSDIGDQGIELRLYDTGGDAAGAATAVKTALDDGAHLILGPLLSRSVSAAAPTALAAGVPVIAFSTDAAVAGKNVYLAGFLPSGEAYRIVDFAAANGIYSYGVLAPETVEGDVTLGAFDRAIGHAGGRIQIVKRYAKTFQDIEAAAKSYAEEHLALVGEGEGAADAGAAQAQTQAQGQPAPGAPGAPLAGPRQTVPPEVGALRVGPSGEPVQAVVLAEGGQALNALASYLPFFDVNPGEVKFLGVGQWNDPIVFTEPSLRGGWFAGPDPTLRAQFAERYEAAFGAKPHALASLGYDAMAAVGAMAQEARRTGSEFPFTKEAITTPAGFGGVNGVFRFRSDGLNDRGLAVLEVGRDGFTVVDPAPTSFSGG